MKEIKFRFTGTQFYILASLFVLDIVVWTAVVLLYGSLLIH